MGGGGGGEHFHEFIALLDVCPYAFKCSSGWFQFGHLLLNLTVKRIKEIGTVSPPPPQKKPPNGTVLFEAQADGYRKELGLTKILR